MWIRGRAHGHRLGFIPPLEGGSGSRVILSRFGLAHSFERPPGEEQDLPSAAVANYDEWSALFPLCRQALQLLLLDRIRGTELSLSLSLIPKQTASGRRGRERDTVFRRTDGVHSETRMHSSSAAPSRDKRRKKEVVYGVWQSSQLPWNASARRCSLHTKHMGLPLIIHWTCCECLLSSALFFGLILWPREFFSSKCANEYFMRRIHRFLLLLLLRLIAIPYLSPIQRMAVVVVCWQQVGESGTHTAHEYLINNGGGPSG